MNRSDPFGLYDDSGGLLTLEDARRAIASFTVAECHDALRRFGALQESEGEPIEALRDRCWSVVAKQYGNRELGPTRWRMSRKTALMAPVWAGLAWLLVHIPILQIPLLLIAAPLQWLGFELTKSNADVEYTFMYVALTSGRINLVLFAYYSALYLAAVYVGKLLGTLVERLE